MPQTSGESSCEDFGLQPGAMICRSDCTVYCTVCGNGILEVTADEQGEVCDLGEQNSYEPNASCRPDCTPRRCGDGIVDFSSGEDCEGDDLGPVEPSCQDFGFHYGELRCNSNCRYDISGCSETCGDGVINGIEQCDGAELNGTTCKSLNYYGGELSCSSLCTFDTSGCIGYCGDGEINGAELCDGEDLGDPEINCQQLGYYGGILSCNANCGFDTSGCEGECGDGEINGPEGVESCDGTQLADKECGSFGYYSGTLSCNALCGFDTSGCFEYCGDGIVQQLEQCDEGPLNSNETVDGCRENCTLHRCGDGVLDSDEVCDDGNNLPLDGCSGDCLSDEICGNGYVDALKEEQCDDGNLKSNDGCSSNCKAEYYTWEQWSKPNITPRFAQAMAYDTARKTLVLFGGQEELGTLVDQTWEFKGSGWIERQFEITPPARRSHSMVYDLARKRVVLFGGNLSGSGLENDTWEYDGTGWNMISTAVSPPVRRSYAMAYDASRGKVVLFGGADQSWQGLDDTWEYDGTDWVQVSTSVSPPPLYLAQMAYDASQGKIYLFGGFTGVTTNDETWEFDGTEWTQLAPASSPAGRTGHQMVYDTLRQKILLFGGADSTLTDLNDSWEFDGNDWTELSTTDSPAPRGGHDMVFNRDLGKVWLYGGSTSNSAFNDVWEFDGTEWSLLEPEESPDPRKNHSMAFDAAHGTTILFGGYDTPTGPGNCLGDTWQFDGHHWSRLSTPTSPPPRDGHVMDFSNATESVVLFGGLDSTQPLNDTWSFDGNTWTDISPGTSPTPRYLSAMVNDPTRNRLVLFGGYGISSALGDTWEFDGTVWIEKYPAHSPSARSSHVMSYDEVSQKVVLVGGNDSFGSPQNDTWEYDGTDWSRITPDPPSPERAYFAMAFNPIRGKSTFFGGATLTETFNEVWEYDGTGWQQPSIANPPPSPRASFDLIYDSVHQRIMIWGGQELSSTLVNDTWFIGYKSLCPDEVCMPGTDGDGDGKVHCEDPDCFDTPFCRRCGDGSCAGREWCGNCPQDCGDCTGCTEGDIQLSEITSGTPAYLEVTNTGTCHWDLGGLTFVYRLDCDNATQAYTFPQGNVVPPGGVYRAVEALQGTMTNEASTGAPFCDNTPGVGWALLCDGFCDLDGCGNVLDTFMKWDGVESPVAPPACVSFSPSPLDVSSAQPGESATRTAFSGGGSAGLKNDWTVAPTSRD